MSGTRDLPLVSVVTETVTVRPDPDRPGSLADELMQALGGLARQTYPCELIDPVVVVGTDVPAGTAGEIARRFPAVRVVETPASNYFAAKNAGARAALGPVVAMLDADCEPQPDWLERLVSGFDTDTAVVAGRTRYTGGSLWMRALSIPSFGHILETRSGGASGFNLNNVAFRNHVLREHPLEERIPRNGGCNLLYHELRAAGERVVYEPRAITAPGVDDVRGSRFVAKHFSRGYDGIVAYRLDEASVLRGTRSIRRFGVAAALAITGRRILRDWFVMARHRRQLDIPVRSAPFFAVVTSGTRLIELAGMARALADPRLRPAGRRESASPLN